MGGKGAAPMKNPSQKRRQQATYGFRQLPREGRLGDPPAWPLGVASPEEKKLWAKLWSLPQAVMWETMRCDDTVALYTRVYCQMVDPEDATQMVKLGNEVRQLDSKLGLSPRAMLDLRWEIEAPPAEEVVDSSPNGDRVFVPKS